MFFPDVRVFFPLHCLSSSAGMYASWLRQPRGHVSSLRQWPGVGPLSRSASFVLQLYIAASSGPPCVCFGPISAALAGWMPFICCRFGDLALRAVVSASESNLFCDLEEKAAVACFRVRVSATFEEHDKDVTQLGVYSIYRLRCKASR